MAVKPDNDMVEGDRISYENIRIDSGIETKYLTADIIQSLFQFGKDERPAPEDNIEVNQLTKPVMIQYYNEAVRNWE